MTAIAIKALILASKNGDIDIINYVIKFGIDVNQAEPNQQSSALHYAAQNNQIEAMAVLLKNGALINQKGDEQCTPLHFCRREGYYFYYQKANIEFLLANGADPNLADNSGKTALHFAAQSGQLDIVTLLINFKANINQQGFQNRTPLHYACGYSHYINSFLIKFLLDKGADPNLAESNGDMALHLAVKINQLDIVFMLINAGAQIDKRGHNLLTPLLLACRNGNKCTFNTDIIWLLLNSEADPNLASIHGYTALHYAAESNQLAVASILINFGAQMDRRSNDNLTPLLFACGYGKDEHFHICIIELLIKQGANLNLADLNDDAPLHLAIKNQKEEIVRLLIDAGADVNQIGSQRTTPLGFACQNKNLNIVKLLLEKGANPNQLTGSEMLFLVLTTRDSNQEICKVIKAFIM